MAFNGSGTFVLVSGNPVVTGTTISSTVQNNTNNDIANGLSNCLTRDGQSTPTSNIPMASFKLTGLAAATLAGEALTFGNPATVTDLTATGTVVLPATTTLPGYVTSGDGAAGLQLQTNTAFTTGGTSTAYTLTPNYALAVFTASIDVSGNMTVTAVTSGTIVIGMRITGTGISAGSYVTGGSGTSWTTNVSVLVASTTVTGTAGLIVNERFRVKFNASSGVAPTLALNGLTAKNLKQFNASGVKIPVIVYANQLADVEYDGTDYVVLDSIQPLGQLQPIGVTQSAGAMTITLNPTTLDFRNSTVDLASGNTVTTLSVPTAITLTIPNTATLGTISAVASKLLLLAINNAGTIELAVCNVWNNTNLNEAFTINTTTISTGATSAVTNYSTTGRTGVYFRVIGELASTQTTAGTWASLPTIKSGGAWSPLVNQITTGTFVNASGTAVTFTGIPPWVKRITIMLVGLSTASTGVPTIRIGTSSGVENTGYGNTIALVASASVVGQVSATSGWELVTNGAAANAYYGNIVLTNFGTANFWNVTGSICAPNATYTFTVAGNKALAGTLTQLQITTTGGTDTFDGGSINIMYE